MNPIRTTTPLEPVTLAEAKQHLRVTWSNEDALIELYIKAARESCEDRLECTLPVTSWRLTLDAFAPAIRLPRGQVTAVTAVRFVDAAGVSQTLAPQEYALNIASTQACIVPAYGKAWPVTRAQINAVEVEYTAGSGNPPTALKAWMLLALGDMYANREGSTDKPSVPHNFADRLLDPYRTWGV
jgi:uncharacterized phiE125 gp8 family phage protein